MPTISSSSPLRTIMRSLRSLNISTIFKYIEKHTIGVLRNKYNALVCKKIISKIINTYSIYNLGSGNYILFLSFRESLNIYIKDINYATKYINGLVKLFYMHSGVYIDLEMRDRSILAAYILHVNGIKPLPDKMLPLIDYLNKNGCYDVIFTGMHDIKKKRKMFNKC
jgi:hypothetical protein